MAYHLPTPGQPNYPTLTRGDHFEPRLDHQNLCVRIRWYPENWSGWMLKLVVGQQDHETIAVYMQSCSTENCANVRILSSPLSELQAALDEFFTDLNDSSRRTPTILNVDSQPIPILPSALIYEIRGCFERIRLSLIRGEILRAPHLRQL